MKSFSIIFLLLFLVSCATAPKREEMQAAISKYQLPNDAQKNEATIYVLRPDSIGGLVRFNIHVGEGEVDQNEIGWTRGNQRLVFYLPPGVHRIASVAENTAVTHIDVRAGEKIFLKQVPKTGILYARNSIYQIDELEGTYWYMNTEDGEHKRKRISIEQKVSEIRD